MNIVKTLTILKALPYKIILYIFLGFAALGIMHTIEQHFSSQTQKNYQRLLDGQLTKKEAEFEKANNDLGVAQSKIVTQEALNKALVKDNADMKAYIKAHPSTVQSQDTATVDIKTPGCNDLKLAIVETVRKGKNSLLESADLKVTVLGIDGKPLSGATATVTDHSFLYTDAPLSLSWYSRLGVSGSIMAGSSVFMSAIGVGYQFGSLFIGPQIGVAVNGSGLSTVYGASAVWFPFSN